MSKFKIQMANDWVQNTSTSTRTKYTDTDHGHETVSGREFEQQPRRDMGVLIGAWSHELLSG